jgi:hypothetical protein
VRSMMPSLSADILSPFLQKLRIGQVLRYEKKIRTV